MAALAGVGASVTEGANPFTDASKWVVSIKGVTKDVTPFGASGNWTINLATLKSWTAKISCFADVADAAQIALFAAANTAIVLVLNISGVPHGFTGTAFLTGIDPSVDVQNAETVDFSFTGSGPITYS